jgi:hypothetical protein
VLLHFRGCSGEPNRLPRSYHSGETGDLRAVIAMLRRREPAVPLAAVGYSLGGNALLKWLGESGSRDLACAVAVSVPFDLARAADRLERGLSRLYQWWFLRSLRASVLGKVRLGRLPATLSAVGELRTLRAFDDAVTAPLHGFTDAADYYGRSSSRQYLGGIAVPTLVLHARDDPFLSADAIPEPSELSACTRLELSAHGGHVGFVAGLLPWHARYWLEERIPAFLRAHLPPPG